jgi:hypothetical protein
MTDDRRVREAIDGLNFSQIKARLTADPSEFYFGKGWSQERADYVERQYRNWLFLSYEHPDELMIPTQDLDEFWHSHILDTKAYAREMELIFGRFLHHDQSLGGGSDEAALQLCDMFDRTAELYEREFGEPYEHYGH